MGNHKLYKHPQYGHCYAEAYATPVGRCVWPSLVKPKAPPPPKDGQAPGQPRYEVTILLPKGDDKTDSFIKAIEEVSVEMRELFNKGRPAKIGEVSVVKDGDEFDEEKYPYYKNNWVLTARNVKPVGTFDVEKKELDPSAITGGHLVKAVVTPLLTAHGISYKLNMVKLVADDGVRIGGAFATEALLGLMDEEEEAPEAKEEAPAKTSKAKSGKQAALDIL